ncbi:MAG: methyltransferase domain-containing protein [Candidatus Aminicenantes bacterium]|nr:methyltransferase domain-containing protein [Candidatus Aminicenantes bacterium]
MKLNLGAGPNWSREGWVTLDHNILYPFRLPRQAWDLSWEDNTFEIVFISHMIEHISHFWIEKTLSEINRVMKDGGILRLLTPDLEVLCKAYVSRDIEKLKLFIHEDNVGTDNGIKMTLGPAQALLGFLYSPGYDNFLLDSSRSKLLGGYAHIFCYDFELLSNLLSYYGFTSIERKNIEDSRIKEHRELRGNRYDIDKNHSLVIECIKEKYVQFDKTNSLLLNGPYPYRDVVDCRKYKFTEILLNFSSRIENFYRWLRRKIKKLLKYNRKNS